MDRRKFLLGSAAAIAAPALLPASGYIDVSGVQLWKVGEEVIFALFDHATGHWEHGVATYDASSRTLARQAM